MQLDAERSARFFQRLALIFQDTTRACAAASSYKGWGAIEAHNKQADISWGY
jgi:hypothetical protein